ncbi:MAG TPA: extracellular solute-binding protein [Acidimicrobiales bacterium]|nr:extracellular solute-binding protein [Acidimicrobiales bacterium]
MKRLAVLLALVSLAGCSVSSDDTGGDSATSDTTIEDVLGDPGDCIVVDMSVSPEKLELLTDLARTFNESDAEVDGECVFVRPQTKSSGLGAQLLAEEWDEDVEGPRPVIWSPASSAWGAILDQRLSEQGEPAMAGEGTPFMLTPLVIAMPQPMAEALGYPDEPVGWADVLELSTNGRGWAAFGHPEWGPFRLGKTNPNFSTSGLSALIAQSYAATGKTDGLTTEDLDQREVVDFATGVESAVVHYGDTTLTFLNNLYRADQRGSSLTYASAVAVEEKSVIDYNRGNPDGVNQPGEEPRPPRVPLVAIYPEEGTLYSDNPFFVLDAEWVDDAERAGAELFQEFVQEPGNQERVLDYGFRPGNPEVAIEEPITAENGVDPDQPQTLLEVPEPPVMVELLERWDEQRKPARVQLVIDVSGSMGDPAGSEPTPTRLDLAREAAIDSIDLFSDRDVVGLRIFSTEIGPDGTDEVVDLVDPAPMTQEQRAALRDAIEGLVPTNGTPLYTAVQTSYDDAVAAYDPDAINAVVLLSDGINDDGQLDDDDEQLDELLESLSAGSEGTRAEPVRVFPIAYSSEADMGTLREIAEASNAAVYNASDPATISRVLAAVISNF